MWNRTIFPYELVKKNSKVVIYGLGMIGHLFIDQIEETEYCQIVAVSDKQDCSNMFSYKYLRLVDICKVEYDFIIIAIDSLQVASDVYWEFVSLGISQRKIVSKFMSGEFFFPTYRKLENFETTEISKPCHIAISLFGGIGDYVVFFGFIKRIISIEPDITIDLYGKKSVMESIFYGVEKVKLYEDVKSRIKRYYDLAIRLIHFVDIEYCNLPLLQKKSSVLYELVLKTINDPHTKDLRFQTGNFLSIYDRALKIGYDRYHFLGHGKIWRIEYSDSHLNLNPEYKNEFIQYSLQNYITLNYGADRNAGEKGKVQTKVWILEYFEELTKLIHQKFPDIRIVQVGDIDSKRIKGVDNAIFGKNLEVVKYILSGSLLHIDCEGGLVHMATQLDTKCVVLFGPTPIFYYGYPQNINIVSDVCTNCCHIKKNWYTSCILGDETPRCMKSISVQRVFDAVCSELEKRD